MAKAKTPAGKIARKLKRSEGATRQKARADSRMAKPKIGLKRTALKKTTAKNAALKKKTAKKTTAKKKA